MILYEVPGKKFNNKSMPKDSMTRLLVEVDIGDKVLLSLLLRLTVCIMITISMVVITIDKASLYKGKGSGSPQGKGSPSLQVSLLIS